MISIVWIQTKYNSMMCLQAQRANFTKNIFVRGAALILNFPLNSLFRLRSAKIQIWFGMVTQEAIIFIYALAENT